MSSDLVTVASFRDLPQALLARGRLQASGIECALADDNLVRLDWFWANAIGGVKLRVRAEDAEAAMEVLSARPPAWVRDEEWQQTYEQPVCPRCDSLEISFGTHDRGWKLLLLQLLGLPVPSLHKPFWRCDACGAEWREDESPR